MAERHKEGRPVAFYELMQGQYDYGRNNTPPPRILFMMSEGSVIEFNGKNVPSHGVASIDFFNAGPGLPPEDIVICRHPSTGATQGEHGRGTTTAMTYLTSRGYEVEVTSNYLDRNWSARTKIGKTVSGVAQVLTLTGTSVPRKEDDLRKTVFSIRNPDEKLLEEIKAIPSLYLFANPEFPRACIVEPNADAQKKVRHSTNVWQGTVECLNDSSSPPEDGYTSLYVDGLNVDMITYYRGTRALFRWSIEGFNSTHEDEVDNSIHVRRSHDSKTVEGEYREVIQEAINQLKDKKLLTEIVKWIFETGNEDERRIEIGDFNIENRKMIGEIWHELYGDTLITNSKNEFDECVRRGQQKVKLLSQYTYDCMAKAEIPTASRFLLDISKSSPSIRVGAERLDEADLLGSLIDLAADSQAESADIIKTPQGDFLRITFEASLQSIGDLSTGRGRIAALVLSTGAYVAHERSLEYKAYSHGPEGYTEIAFKVHGQDVSPRLFPPTEVAEFKTGPNTTALFFKINDDTETFRHSFAPLLTTEKSLQLIDRFSKKKSTLGMVKARFGALKDKLTKPAQPKVLKSIVGVNKYPEEHTHVNLPDGYFTKHILADLDVDEHSNSLVWVAADNLAKVEVPQLQRGDQTTNRRHELPLYYGGMETPLDVGVGEVPHLYTTLDGAPVAFYRNKHTGTWYAQGNTPGLIYFTRPTTPEEESQYRCITPKRSEVKDILGENLHRLRGENGYAIQNFIRENKDLGDVHLKVQSALKFWSNLYTYDNTFVDDAHERFGNIESAIVSFFNKNTGVCNGAATGFVLILRALGVPARYVAGSTVNFKEKASHAWCQYWDGVAWREIEPQSEYDRTYAPRIEMAASAELQDSRGTIATLAQNEARGFSIAGIMSSARRALGRALRTN